MNLLERICVSILEIIGTGLALVFACALASLIYSMMKDL